MILKGQVLDCQKESSFLLGQGKPDGANLDELLHRRNNRRHGSRW